MNRGHVSAFGIQLQANPAEGTLLTLCVSVWVVGGFEGGCNMSICVWERMSAYFSCCVLGSALNGAILSVFHLHLPWQRCLMTHPYTDTHTKTHARSHLCHGIWVLRDTAGEDRKATLRSCTMCLPFNPFLFFILSFFIFFLSLTLTQPHKYQDVISHGTLTKTLMLQSNVFLIDSK